MTDALTVYVPGRSGGSGGSTFIVLESLFLSEVNLALESRARLESPYCLMEESEQLDVDSHGNRFITSESQVQTRDTVVRDEWAKRYKPPLVEKVSFHRGGSRHVLGIRFHHVASVEVVGRATSE
ncbi:MAG TPA: hypothetical protein VJ743_08825 [Albitalea sp.]|nr:hypothetical protein [Albitalea sp.]